MPRNAPLQPNSVVVGWAAGVRHTERSPMGSRTNIHGVVLILDQASVEVFPR